MNDRRPYIVLGIAALIILLFFIFVAQNKRINWDEHYKADSKDPHGTIVMHKLLETYYPDYKLEEVTKNVTKKLSDVEDLNANYVFVGQALYLDTTEINTLLEFVKKGNTAFIASKSIPNDLMFYVYYEECNYNAWNDYTSIWMRDSITHMNLLHSDLKDSIGYDFTYTKDSDRGFNFRNNRWHYIDTMYFCQEDFSLVELGMINEEQVNFAKMDYGEGSFYLHTNPLVFTNFFMKENVGYTYASKVFSHLSEGPIYWDKCSHIDENVSRRRNRQANSRTLSSEGPLKYVLSQPSLAWAWYASLALGLVYLMFRAKRRQRAIPVLEKNTNTSMEFISTIGRLYFVQNDHRKLSLMKMKLFLAYVRDRYNIPTKKIDDDFVKRLTIKSEISETIIRQIITFAENIKSSDFVSEKTLIDFHLEMDKFYKNCK